MKFYSCKEIFTRSYYSKLLLNQGHMLFVLNMSFYVPFLNFYHIFQPNCRLKRLAGSPNPITLLVKIMLIIVMKSFFTLINVTAYP